MKAELGLFQATILGSIEGITEFLPISSTGHLILASYLLGIEHNNFLKTFEITIQSGAILAIVFLYWQKLIKSFKLLLAGFLPTAIVGFLLYRPIKDYLIGSDIIVVFSSIIGGFLLILLDRYTPQQGKEPGVKEAMLIGLFQSVAFIPGVSRSGACFAGGLILGLGRKESAEFSFLLAVPTVLAASIYDLFKSVDSFNIIHWQIMLLGFISALVFAFLGIKLMLIFANKNALSIFGTYRILIGAIYGFLFI
ncbi:MAG: undecaprenyl-diphosphate phosphatase [Aquificaceae bacterium]